MNKFNLHDAGHPMLVCSIVIIMSLVCTVEYRKLISKEYENTWFKYFIDILYIVEVIRFYFIFLIHQFNFP